MVLSRAAALNPEEHLGAQAPFRGGEVADLKPRSGDLIISFFTGVFAALPSYARFAKLCSETDSSELFSSELHISERLCDAILRQEKRD